MANVKISQLDEAVILTGSEEVPVVQDGTTVKTTTQDIADLYALGYTAENVANKSTVTSLGTSNTLYPTQNAVKVYADTAAATAAAGKELLVNKSINTALGTSDTLYPSQNAVKVYVDGSVVGLLDDRGSYTPSVTSPGAYPSTGGSGGSGAIQKGDLWFMSASGFLGTTAVAAGATVRALANTPGQTGANWNILSAGAISITTPNLDKVTTAGSTSTNDIVVSKNGGGSIFTEDLLTQKLATLSTNGGNSGYLQLTNIGAKTGTIYSENITDNRDYQLPDASGTLALLSDITNPTLQQVTDAGSITTNDISISGINNSVQTRFSVYQPTGFYSASIGQNTSRGGYLQLVGTNGFNEGVVLAQNLTASRTYQLPNASGTLALTSDIGGNVQTVKVSLSSAQLLALGDTPITLIPAQGAGTLIRPICATVRNNYGTIVYVGGNLGINYDGGGSWLTNQITAHKNSDDVIQNVVLGANGNWYTSPINASVKIYPAGGSIIGGDGTVDIYVTYTTITL